MGGMGKPGDQQTWVYGTTLDAWFGGATSGGSGGSGGPIVATFNGINFMSVLTASLLQTTTIAVGSYSTLCSVTASWTDVEVWGKISGIVGTAANTLWTKIQVDNVDVPNVGTFTEVVNNGAGFGTELHGRITGLSSGTHTFTLLAKHGGGAAVTINVPGSFFPHEGASIMVMNLTSSFTASVSQSFAAIPGAFAVYNGHCTGSLLWSATGSWSPALSVPGNFTDVITNRITRSGSTFTLAQAGTYRFSSHFDSLAGANGTYIAYRLSGSNGTVMQRTTFASDNPQSAILDGIFVATAGAQFTLQYLTTGAIEQTWSTLDPIGTSPDTENMRTGHIDIFLVPSGTTVLTQSFVTNNTVVTGTVGPGYPNANYAFVTASNQWNVPSGQTFVGHPGLTASITTTGNPVLILADANYMALVGTSQAAFTIFRDGVNLGNPTWGMMGAGPLLQSYNNSVSIAFADFPPAGTHTYVYCGCNPTGSGAVSAYGCGPASLALFEMRNANVVTASVQLQQAVPGTVLVGLSASIVPTKGPVLAIFNGASTSDAGGNWSWNTLRRNGSDVVPADGLGLIVGSNANEYMNANFVYLDQNPPLGTTVTYAVAATNGQNTNKYGLNNMMCHLILWELTDVNWKYIQTTAQVTAGSGYTDVVVTSPQTMLVTRGRPVLLMSTLNINTNNAAGRTAWSYLRNGTSVTTASHGLQVVDGEGSNDWNRMATAYWVDVVSPAAYIYQVAGLFISSSAFTAQGTTTTFFMYELDAGLTNGTIFGGWLDNGNLLSTTASVKIGGNLTVGGTFAVSGALGNYASRPAPGNVGAQFTTLDGSLRFIDDGTTWRPIIGKTLGFQVPASASWASVFTAGAQTTVQDDTGGLFLSASSFSGTAQDFRILKVAMPVTLFSATIHFRPLFPPNAHGLPWAGLVLRESSTGKVDSWGMYFGGPANKSAGAAIPALNRNWNTASDTSSAPASFTNVDFNDYHLSLHPPMSDGGFWLQILYDPNGAKSYRYSPDGKHFKDVITVAHTDVFTPNEVGFCIGNVAAFGNAGGTDAAMMMYVDSWNVG